MLHLDLDSIRKLHAYCPFKGQGCAKEDTCTRKGDAVARCATYHYLAYLEKGEFK